MAVITLNISDDLDDRERAELIERLFKVVDPTVRVHRGNGRKAVNGGSLMGLAGCFPYNGPLLSKEVARAMAQRHVAENFPDKDG